MLSQIIGVRERWEFLHWVVNQARLSYLRSILSVSLSLRQVHKYILYSPSGKEWLNLCVNVHVVQFTPIIHYALVLIAKPPLGARLKEMGVLALVDENRYADYTTRAQRVRKSYVQLSTQAKLFIFTSRRLYAHAFIVEWVLLSAPITAKRMKNEQPPGSGQSIDTHSYVNPIFFISSSSWCWAD